MSDKIQKSYRQSRNIYDDVLTRSTWWSRLYMDIFWGGVDDNEIARTVLSYIPDDFSGKRDWRRDTGSRSITRKSLSCISWHRKNRIRI